MKFWDASAIVPLLVVENRTPQLQLIAAKDSAMLVWWGSAIECNSALSRRQREGALNAQTAALALRRLEQLAQSWHEIDPSDVIRESAIRFLRVHSLRAADALQLAAAFAAAERRPPSLELVTLDDNLADAARREGFELVEPTTLR